MQFLPLSERERIAKVRKKTENQQYNLKIVNMIKTNSEFTIIEYINLTTKNKDKKSGSSVKCVDAFHIALM